MLRKYIMSIILVIFSAGCDPIDDHLKITNNSGNEIHFVNSKYRDLHSLYPEGLDSLGITITYNNYIKSIENNTSQSILLTGSNNAWARYINGACEDKKIHIFLFELDTLKKYSWKNVIDNNRFKRKMEFTVEDLNRINWNIKIEE